MIHEVKAMLIWLPGPLPEKDGKTLPPNGQPTLVRPIKLRTGMNVPTQMIWLAIGYQAQQALINRSIAQNEFSDSPLRNGEFINRGAEAYK